MNNIEIFCPICQKYCILLRTSTVLNSVSVRFGYYCSECFFYLKDSEGKVVRNLRYYGLLKIPQEKF